ncbi:hypothetical protein B0T19DRAFT_438272 [Cercophora scortea]|uniref:Uncharacterized protein n=1 Tax=Cercophora scortea TaxID=314031 RepID=A0AAE0J6S9_9PEZI|nr:hypothetical protein B0T19DRAFT_438272 [Cercophora scortea]
MANPGSSTGRSRAAEMAMPHGQDKPDILSVKLTSEKRSKQYRIGLYPIRWSYRIVHPDTNKGFFVELFDSAKIGKNVKALLWSSETWRFWIWKPILPDFGPRVNPHEQDVKPEDRSPDTFRGRETRKHLNRRDPDNLAVLPWPTRILAFIVRSADIRSAGDRTAMPLPVEYFLNIIKVEEVVEIIRETKKVEHGVPVTRQEIFYRVVPDAVNPGFGFGNETHGVFTINFQDMRPGLVGTISKNQIIRVTLQVQRVKPHSQAETYKFTRNEGSQTRVGLPKGMINVQSPVELLFRFNGSTNQVEFIEHRVPSFLEITPVSMPRPEKKTDDKKENDEQGQTQSAGGGSAKPPAASRPSSSIRPTSNIPPVSENQAEVADTQPLVTPAIEKGKQKAIEPANEAPPRPPHWSDRH